MAIYNISKRRLRSLLTILGIVIGVASIVGIVSLGSSLQENVYSQLSKIGGDVINIVPMSFRAGSSFISGVSFLTTSDQNLVEKVPGVEEVYALISSSLTVGFEKETTVLSINGIENPRAWENAEAERVGLEAGRFLTDEDKYSAVIGNMVAHEVFSNEIEEKKTITINGTEFRVVGILNNVGGILSSLDRSVYIPISTARDFFGGQLGNDEFSVISAKVARGYDANVVSDEIDKALLDEKKENDDTRTFTVVSPQFFQETIGSVLGTLTLFVGAIAAISLIVGGIGITNIMYVSVMERTREIGVMKAIGAESNTILLLFLFESGIIGLVGGIIGDAIGVVFSYGLSFVISAGFEMTGALGTIIVNPEILMAGAVFGFGVGVVSGFLPSRKASKLQPVEALRYE